MKYGHTTKYDRNSTHAYYGITVWMRKIGVVNQELQDSLIEGFLKAEGFNAPQNIGKKALHRVKAVFISNRFDKFSSFVLKNTAQIEQE